MAGLKLVAELGGDASGFNAMMGRAGSSIKQLGWSMGGLKSMIAGAFTVGSLAAATNLIRKTADYADRIDETSNRLGIAADKLQEWEYAAKQSGASAEQLLRFIEKISIAASDPKKTKFFEQMGFNPEGMTPEQLFKSTASFARQNSSTTVTAALARVIGERVGGQLTLMLQSDLEALGKQARSVGAVMDQQTMQALAKLNDQFSILSQILYGNFGPALLEAGKMALTAFYGLQGLTGFAGARTANVHAKDLAPLLLGPAGIGWAIARARDLKAQGDEMGLGGMADAEFKAQIDKLEAALKSITDVPPFIPGTVHIAEAEAKKAARVRLSQPDELIRVGNFLGRNPSLVGNVAEQQLQVARQALATQAQILAVVKMALRNTGLSLLFP